LQKVPVQADWKDVMPLIITDSRYQLVPTLAARKELVSVWQSEAAERAKIEEEENFQRMRAAFLELLATHKTLDPEMSYRYVCLCCCGGACACACTCACACACACA
jgi:hypothetical protein